MLLSIDHGNRCMKTVHTNFVSGIAKFVVEPPMVEDLIHYKDSYFALTDERLSYRRDKTLNDDFYLLTLFSIVKEMEAVNAYDPYKTIHLAVGLPPEHFGALHDSFSEYLLRDKRPVDFLYNGMEYELQVTQVDIFPQAYAAIASDPILYAEIKRYAQALVVDIGGYTSDSLLLRKGRIDMNFLFSPETGVIKLYNKAQRLINSKYGMHIMEEQIDDVLQSKDTFLPDEIHKIILEVARAHTESMLDTFIENGFDLHSLPVIFVGGGALLLRPFLEESSKINRDSARYIEDICANAKGYDALARALKSKRNKF